MGTQKQKEEAQEKKKATPSKKGMEQFLSKLKLQYKRFQPRGNHYVKTYEANELMLQPRVEYEATVKDEEWLSSHHKTFSLGDFEQLIDLFEKTTGTNPSPARLDDCLRMAPSLFPNMKKPPKDVLESVYRYWNKGREQTNKPFLRKFWPKPEPGDQGPFVSFRASNKGGMKLRRNTYKDKEDHIRNGFFDRREELIKARGLLELSYERELFKSE